MFAAAFTGLREHTLRRLYKFILKRILGPYLESELLLEQLEIDSGQGLVLIRNLRLHCDVLNEYLTESPFQLVEAEILELQASISYNTLLSDGCNLKCRGIKFIVTSRTPSSKKEQPLSTDGVYDSDNLSSSTHFGEFEEKLTDDSVGFIAQWIEVIIARLTVSVENLHIIFLSSVMERPTTSLHLTLSSLEFYNSHPRLTKDDGGTMMVASNLYLSHGSGNSLTKSLVAAMSNRKLVTLEGFSLDFIHDTLPANMTLDVLKNLRSHSLFNMKSGARIDIQLSSTSNLTYGSVDIDVSIPCFDVELQLTTVPLLIQFVTSLELGKSDAQSSQVKSRKSSPLTDFSGIGEDIIRLEEGLRRLHMNQTISSLERLEAEGDEGEEINFKRLSQLLQQYQLTRERLNQTVLKKPSADEGSVYDVDDSALVLSEDEFDDDDDDDFDFYDVSEGHREASSHIHKVTKKMKSSMMHSIYGKTSLAEMSQMFYSTEVPRTSADESTMSRSAERLRSDAGVFLRIFIDTITFTFEDDRSSLSAPNVLQLQGSSLVFSSSLPRNSPPTFSLNLAEISLIEKLWNSAILSELTLLSFTSDPPRVSSMNIPMYALDHQRCSESRSLASPQMEISVVMKQVAEGGINVSVNFQHAVCTLSLALINRWASTIGEFLAPQASPSSSIAFSCSVQFQSIEISLAESFVDPSEFNFLSQSILLPNISTSRWTKLSESPILEPRPGGGFRLVFHGLCLSASSCDKPSNSSSIVPLTVSVEEINCFLQFFIDEKNAWELGFLAFRSVKGGSKISLSKERYTGPEGTSSKSEIEDTERVLPGDSFEMPNLAIPDVLVVSAGNVYADLRHFDFEAFMAIIGLFISDKSSSPSSPEARPATINFGIKISSRSLTINLSEDDKNTESQYTYIFAIRDPLVEYYKSTVSDMAKQYIGLLASDISLYEMSTVEVLAIEKVSGRGARVPENYSRVPLLHRTSLEQSWKSNFERSKHRVLSVRFASSEELNSHSFPSHQVSSLHISLKDMTYRFHASPVWFTKIPQFFIMSSNASSSSSDRNSSFGQTHLNISIQKFMIDFCQPQISSRLILIIGLLTLNSTLVSNTPRIGIKLKVSDVSVRLSNKLLLETKWEQSPLGPQSLYEEELEMNEDEIDLDTFFDVHTLVIMSTFDHLECRLDLNSDQRNKHFFGDQPRVPVVALEANAGLCCLYGCADSLLVLTNTCQYLSEVLKVDDDEEPIVEEDVHLEDDIPNDQPTVPAPDCSKPLRTRLIPVVKNRPPNVSSFDESDEDIHESPLSKHYDEKNIDNKDDYHSDTVPSDYSLKASWMKGISEDMFRPRPAQQLEEIETSDSVSQLDITEDMSVQGFQQTTPGLNQAIIEDYYPGRQYSESPEFEAKYYPQYDYDEDDGGSQLEMSGFLAMDEEDHSDFPDNKEQYGEENGSVLSGLYGSHYDSDIELPDDFDEKPLQTVPNMWDSWGVLKNINSVPLKHEDIELDSLHSEDQEPPSKIGPPRESFDIVDEQKYLPQEENLNVDDDMTLRTSATDRQNKILQVVQGPYDEDMQRAWAHQLEDLPTSDVETLAGWYTEAPKVTTLHIPVPTREDLDTIEDDHSYPRVRVKVAFSLRVRFFSGEEWPSVQSVTVVPTVASTSPQGTQRSTLFKDTSSHRIHKNLVAASKPPKAVKFSPTSQSGRNFANSTEISLTNITVHFRTYDSELKRRNNLPQSSIPALKEQPLRKIVVKVHDFLISYSPIGAKPKKILGYWKNYHKPIESNKPLLEMTITGFNIPSQTCAEDLEYRLTLSILPLRCYLDGRYIQFLKVFASQFGNLHPPTTTTQVVATGEDLPTGLPPALTDSLDNKFDEKDMTLSPPPSIYFQSWRVNVIDLKIDYTPDQLDLQALQLGDYTQVILGSFSLTTWQLLNIFAIDGLEITLTKVRLSGISGVSAGVQKCLEEWVNEIYAHQMHRLISGASPLRGLSNIGANIHGLLMIPVQEYKKKGAAGVVRALQRQSMSLLKIITRETLHASHKVSHFIANSLVELVAPESANSPRRQSHDQSNRQPVGFLDSLDLAYNAISREIHSTLDTIVVMPVRQYSRSGPGGVLRSVIRAIPVAILRPTAGAAEALSYTLLGLRNNVDPSARRDEEDMWEVTHSRGTSRRSGK